MTTIRIKSNQSYTVELASAILGCNPGDTIIVNSTIRKEIAEHAMKAVCPGKDVKIVVESECENEQRA